MVRGALILPVRAYQRFVSPLLTPRCKYHPSCSEYLVQAIRSFGVVRGLVLGGWRLLRCNPWSLGGIDPAERQGIFPLSRHHAP